MRKIFFISLFVLMFAFANAQNENKPEIRLTGNLAFSGQGLVFWSIPNFSNFKLGATPALQGKIGFLFPSNFDLDLVYTYQHFYLSYKDAVLFARVDLMKNSFGLRASYAVVKKQYFDLYLGGRFSVNYWLGTAAGSVELDSIMGDSWEWRYAKIILNPVVEEVENSLNYDISTQWYNFPFQFFIGANQFISKRIGLNFELALGSPYWATTGLILKIN